MYMYTKNKNTENIRIYPHHTAQSLTYYYTDILDVQRRTGGGRRRQCQPTHYNYYCDVSEFSAEVFFSSSLYYGYFFILLLFFFLLVPRFVYVCVCELDRFYYKNVMNLRTRDV